MYAFPFLFSKLCPMANKMSAGALVLCGNSISIEENAITMGLGRDAMAPDISPGGQPRPFLPSLAPSPLIPFINSSVPALSGLCMLNFSAVENLMSVTATDCWASFAPYLANVVCCPQFDAILFILMGQSSKNSGMLALNSTHSRHCLSDVEKILVSRGANENLPNICSVHSANLTGASCPVIDVIEFESSVDTSRLLSACEKIDPVRECCDQVCGNAILDAARKISLTGSSLDDCKGIVMRWLASKLDPSSANVVLRGLSNCNLNKVCPLEFPNITKVAEDCEGAISNQSACCKAMESYTSRLQGQCLLTNLQALNCAASLGMKLQRANVSKNLYNLCHVNLKDFSIQVFSQASGCLLPSLPSDATFDKSSGISFICDLNDNIAAPWPSTSFEPVSSCNKTNKIPALPTTTSAQCGIHIESIMFLLLFVCLMFLQIPP
ncbi:hypothetical protein SAY86_023386 [Trapa natans]|uniref:SPARK domain-containing protein n=1 Tax=Trapa natans TaxID=22666 RepID=A0AAN7MAB2_TRANT|nr:hypothetical protein SAY86_023386 [Trapa natans]